MRRSGRRNRRDRAPRASRPVALLCCAAAVVIFPGPALALFSATSSSPSMSVSTATLAAASGLGAAGGACVPLTSTTVTLTWTATTSTFADGYEIFRSGTSGGPYTSIGTASGQATITYLDTAVTFGTTYHYVIQAKILGWRSPNSNQASVTTPGTLCL